MKKLKGIVRYDIYAMAYRSLPDDKKEDLIDKCFKKYGKDDVYYEPAESDQIAVFEDNSKKQLENVCKVFGINLAKDFAFLTDKQPKPKLGRQQPKIPVTLAPLLIAILRNGTNRGGYVSRIANMELDKITIEQKRHFIRIYHQELIRAKQYSNITSKTIYKIIGTLLTDVQREEEIGRFTKRLDAGIFRRIKHDIRAIHRVNAQSGVVMPNVQWLKDCVRKHIIKDETEPPAATCVTDTCDWYDMCQSADKSRECFRGIGTYEREYLTDIYIGMLTKAREQFQKFMLELKESEAEHILDDSKQDAVCNEETAKQCISAALYEGEFAQYVDRAALKRLEGKGIGKSE